jgi:hypothetical protein
MYTNKGVVSPRLGQNTGGQSRMEYIPDGGRLVGFLSCWDEKYLKKIKFYYGKAIYPTY